MFDNKTRYPSDSLSSDHCLRLSGVIDLSLATRLGWLGGADEPAHDGLRMVGGYCVTP